MKRYAMTACVGLMLMLTATASAYEWDMVLLEANPITWDGQAAWEYIYDIYGTPYNDFHLKGFDATRVLNMYEGAFWDKWEGWAAGYESWICNFDPWTYQSPHYPSYGEGNGDDVWWVHPTEAEIIQNDWGNPAYWPGRGYDPVHAATHGIENSWHAPSEYAAGAGNSWMGGQVRTVGGGDAYDGLYFGYFTVDSQDWTGANLEMTIRMIHMDGPYGTIEYDPDGFDGNIVVGPGGSLPGDFDGDGDIDADDIDILCANMGSGDLATYDLDDSGVVDEDDMILLVETLVEYDTDGDGTADGQGTFQGDFNLDGVVNATDLQIMKGNFGVGGVGFAGGNANCDTVVNATDLQILKAKFGLVASAVPEPLTIGLLAAGATALLRRKR